MIPQWFHILVALERRGITGRGGNRFGVGGLAHLLRNRFYVGEVAYQGEIHPGPQQPIVDRAMFQAVQDILDAQAIQRQGRLASSAALLTGLITDERGNRLTPSHTNKRGQRYRYYVSQAVLQNDKAAVGSVTRIAAPDLEATVVAAVQSHLGFLKLVTDRELIDMHVRSVVIAKGRLVIEVYSDAASFDREIQPPDFDADAEAAVGQPDDAPAVDDRDTADRPAQRLTIPWTRRDVHRAKGIRDDGRPGLSDAVRDQMLRAIAKARRWMHEVSHDATTFSDLAEKEGCVERHVRFLAPLAYLSPRRHRCHRGRARARGADDLLARSRPAQGLGNAECPHSRLSCPLRYRPKRSSSRCRYLPSQKGQSGDC